MTMDAVRPHVGRLTTLLAAPAIFWTILVVLTPVGHLLAAALGTLTGRGVEIAGGGIRFGSDSDGPGLIAALAMASLVAAAVVWRTARVGHKLRVPTPALVVPTVLALGSVVVGWLPAVGSLPALLTIGTPFAFALLSGARPRQPA